MENFNSTTAYPETSQSRNGGQYLPPGYSQQPISQAGNPSQYPHLHPQLAYVTQVPTFNSSIATIHDWLPWSIINLFVGWLFAGILPLIFSLVCRSKKKANNAHDARTMSVLALVFNILVTLAGISGWIVLIIFLVLINKKVCSIYTYPYYC